MKRTSPVQVPWESQQVCLHAISQEASLPGCSLSTAGCWGGYIVNRIVAHDKRNIMKSYLILPALRMMSSHLNELFSFWTWMTSVLSKICYVIDLLCPAHSIFSTFHTFAYCIFLVPLDHLTSFQVFFRTSSSRFSCCQSVSSGCSFIHSHWDSVT